MTAPRKSRAKKAPPAPASAEPAAEWVAIDAIKAWDANPRDNAEAIDAVAASIKRFGFASPIIARRADGEIIAGHTRWAAAKKLRFDRIPVRYLDLDPADAHLLALADNKLGEIAEWSVGLGDVLRQLRDEDQEGVAEIGWSRGELRKLLDGIGRGRGGDDEEAGDQSDLLEGGRFQVLVDCEGEQHQAELLERLTGEGLQCRALMS